MTEHILELLEKSGAVISLFAVAVIIVGFVLATAGYALRFRAGEFAENFSRFKVQLGEALTLGLEILVLADVIETITVEPTYRSLIVLAFLVIIRTALSWTLTLEVEGRWPWQAPLEEQEHA